MSLISSFFFILIFKHGFGNIQIQTRLCIYNLYSKSLYAVFLMIIFTLYRQEDQPWKTRGTIDREQDQGHTQELAHDPPQALQTPLLMLNTS